MNTDVVIGGAGPNGLMLACELGLAGVRSVVLERLPGPSDEPKANGLVGQVVQLVDRRGLYERLARQPGPPRPNSVAFMFAALPLDLSRLEHSPLYTALAPQPHIVRVLAERATELGVDVRWGHEVVDLRATDESVTVTVSGPDVWYALDAAYLIGADGAHSTIRKRSGIGFPGVTRDRVTARHGQASVPAEWVDPSTQALVIPGFGRVMPFQPHRTDTGAFSYAPFPDRAALIATSEWDQPTVDGPMSMDELASSIRRVLGVDVPLTPPTGPEPHVLRRLQSRNVRVADRFRAGRVFLVGDAAHVGTAGGSGLNLGMQDAVNLGWKLAAVLNGQTPHELLESYEPERRAAADRMVMFGEAQAALIAPGPEVNALRQLVTELLASPDTIQHLAALSAGADQRYDMGVDDPHPIVGTFAPELDLVCADGPSRLSTVVRNGHPLLLDLAEGSVAAKLDWPDHLDVLPASATAAPATVMLVRPDGYVAWATSTPHPTDTELADQGAAVHRWIGGRPQ